MGYTAERAGSMAMASAAKVWTVADLAEMPDDGNRYEVIDGELHVTPAPTSNHQRAIGRLYLILAPYVEQQRLGEVLFAPIDVTFSDKRGVQPDLLVAPFVDGKRIRISRELRDFPLVVEVLSPSTARWDRVKKRRLYREERIPEYWIVDLDARVFERSTASGEAIEVASERLVWAPDGSDAPLTIDVERYFAHVLDD
jgi:Uma2 family endonuclease